MHLYYLLPGEKDHIIPPSLNKKNFDSYTDKSSKKEFNFSMAHIILFAAKKLAGSADIVRSDQEN